MIRRVSTMRSRKNCLAPSRINCNSRQCIWQITHHVYSLTVRRVIRGNKKILCKFINWLIIIIISNLLNFFVAVIMLI